MKIVEITAGCRAEDKEPGVYDFQLRTREKSAEVRAAPEEGETLEQVLDQIYARCDAKLRSLGFEDIVRTAPQMAGEKAPYPDCCRYHRNGGGGSNPCAPGNLRQPGMNGNGDARPVERCAHPGSAAGGRCSGVVSGACACGKTGCSPCRFNCPDAGKRTDDERRGGHGSSPSKPRPPAPKSPAATDPDPPAKSRPGEGAARALAAATRATAAAVEAELAEASDPYPGGFETGDKAPVRSDDEMPLSEWVGKKEAAWRFIPEPMRMDDPAVRGLMAVIKDHGGKALGYWSFLMDRPKALEDLQKWARRHGWKGTEVRA